MSANMNGSQQYVPWSVYLQDRRELAESMRRIEGKVDRLSDEVKSLAIEQAKDDAAEIATDAATEGIERSRRSRSERFWEFAKQTWAALLALLGAALLYWLTGGTPP